MEAHGNQAGWSAPAALSLGRRLGLLAALLLVSMGARQRSANFIIETPDPTFARQVSQAAEQFRHDLAIEWLGKTMPNWAQPCVLTVQAAPHLGNGGATTFVFDRGEVFGWRMTIQGSRERILDSVLPHEITHMIFASRFRQPLPRWADEGGATSVEHLSERNKYRQMLYRFLRTGRGIAFNRMFAMTEYPPDMMPLYAQGYSLAEYLIQTGGQRKYVEFMGDALQTDDWPGAIQRHYGVKDLGVLQTTWLAWVEQGSPALQPRDPVPTGQGERLAAATPHQRPAPNLIHHSPNKQSPTAELRGLVPVRMSSNTGRTPYAVADNRRLAPPTRLPTSGWRAAGQPNAPPTQVTRPQPPEAPAPQVLR